MQLHPCEQPCKVPRIVSDPIHLLLFLIALLVGFGCGWWWCASRAKIATTDLNNRLAEISTQYQEEAQRRAAAEATRTAERVAEQEKLQLLSQTETTLATALKGLCADALQHNNNSFLQLATTTLTQFQESAKSELQAREQAVAALVEPIRQSLTQVDGKIGELEKSRLSAYAALNEQLRSLVDTHLPTLRSETSNLVKALRQPQVRGRWGEIQLKRVVEMAGMLEHCDFVEQTTSTTSDGRLRPDLIVRLPGGKQVIVDAKAVVSAYLEATEAADDEVQRLKLNEHARQVRQHMTSLGRKAYWEQFSDTPEFVVMFLPGEVFFSAALQHDPELIEFGVNERVIPATPTTLIALLRSVAYGWRQEALARNAQEVAQLGRQLHERVVTLADHWNKVGDRLGKAVEAYNQATSTLESRVMISTRKLHELKAAKEDTQVALLEPIDKAPRVLTAATPIANNGESVRT
jgi:DNA recombination protein RmuC